MAIAVIMQADSAEPVAAALRKELPDIRVDAWPSLDDSVGYTMAIAWKPPAGALAALPAGKLELIQSYGAGVDGLLADQDLPDVPLAGLRDPQLAQDMSEYVLLQLLAHRRRLPQLQEAATKSQWSPQLPQGDRSVLILGAGNIGLRIAHDLNKLGWPVRAWASRAGEREGIEVLAGQGDLRAALGENQYVVSVLPDTSETHGLANSEFFEAMRADGLLINVGRGSLVDEQALLKALEEEQLAGAVLDVFASEPLPQGHPFWGHPRIFVTPHCAAPTRAETAVKFIADNFRRLQNGQHVIGVVRREHGY